MCKVLATVAYLALCCFVTWCCRAELENVSVLVLFTWKTLICVWKAGGVWSVEGTKYVMPGSVCVFFFSLEYKAE